MGSFATPLSKGFNDIGAKGAQSLRKKFADPVNRGIH